MNISDADRFRHEVYNCKYCDGSSFDFESPSRDKPFFKFPPTIGSASEAYMLFVGINPRLSGTNKDLHTTIMNNIQAFDELANNRYKGRKYIAVTGGIENHYHNHALIAETLFPEQPFEKVAAVTELFFCATRNASELPVDTSPCANLFLTRTILQVKPKLIIPVGKQALRYFQKRFKEDEEVFKIEINGCFSWVVPMSHPNARPKDQKWEIGWTIENIKRSPPSIGPTNKSDIQKSDLMVDSLCLRTYKYSRLCFRADKIEPLSKTDHFRIVTPVGTFQMSKEDFYRDFSNVVESDAYKYGRRIYNYPKVPSKARKYQIEGG